MLPDWARILLAVVGAGVVIVLVYIREDEEQKKPSEDAS